MGSACATPDKDIKSTLDNTVIFSPTGDLLSRKILGSAGHESITLGFIQDMLDIEVAEVVIENPYDIKTYIDGTAQGLRQTIVDVQARLSSGIQVIIEIQVGHQSWLDRRMLYYVASRYVANLGGEVGDIGASAAKSNAGDALGLAAINPDKYARLNPVYCICVLKHRYFKDDTDAYRCYRLYDANHSSGYGIDGVDLMRLAFLELPKQVAPEHVNLLHWEQLFNGKEIDGDAPDYIKEAASLIKQQNLSTEEASMITAEQQRQYDHDAEIHWAVNEGILQGISQGISQGIAQGVAQGEARRMQDAQNLLDLGVSPEIIKQATGFDAEEICRRRSH